ncbi:MAG: sodium:solute symporter family protein [Moorellales bacterium]
MAGWVFLALGLYVAAGMLVALAARRGLSREAPTMVDFFLGNRTLSGLVNALTYSATTYSAFMMVGLAGYTYQGGVGALGFELIYLSGLLLAAFFGPRFWLAAKDRGYITVAEMLGDRYQSRTLAVVAALVSLVFLIPYSAVQLMGIGYLISGLSFGTIPFALGVLMATFTAVVWAWIGGLRSVAWTDALQALVMLFTAVLVLFFVVYGQLGGFAELFGRLEAQYPQWLQVPGPGFFRLSTFLSLTLPWFFFCLSNPQVSQRLYVPHSLKGMRTMIGGFLVFGLVYTVIAVLWGFCARVLLPDLPSPDLATPTLLASPAVPKVLALLALAGITAAAVSTIDSILLTLSSTFARDVYRTLRPQAAEVRQVQVAKWVIPVFSLLAMFFAFLRLDLIATLSVASSAGLLVTVPPIIGAFCWKRGTAVGALAAMLVGGTVVAVLQFEGWRPLGLGAGIWGLAVAVAGFVLGSLLTRAPVTGEEFVTRLRQALAEKNAL